MVQLTAHPTPRKKNKRDNHCEDKTGLGVAELQQAHLRHTLKSKINGIYKGIHTREASV